MLRARQVLDDSFDFWLEVSLGAIKLEMLDIFGEILQVFGSKTILFVDILLWRVCSDLRLFPLNAFLFLILPDFNQLPLVVSELGFKNLINSFNFGFRVKIIVHEMCVIIFVDIKLEKWWSFIVFTEVLRIIILSNDIIRWMSHMFDGSLGSILTTLQFITTGVSRFLALWSVQFFLLWCLGVSRFYTTDFSAHSRMACRLLEVLNSATTLTKLRIDSSLGRFGTSSVDIRIHLPVDCLLFHGLRRLFRRPNLDSSLFPPFGRWWFNIDILFILHALL